MEVVQHSDIMFLDQNGCQIGPDKPCTTRYQYVHTYFSVMLTFKCVVAYSSSEYPYFRLRNESLYFRLFARNSCGIGIFHHRDTDITGILSLFPLRLRGELKSDFHVSLRDILRFGTTPVRKYCSRSSSKSSSTV